MKHEDPIEEFFRRAVRKSIDKGITNEMLNAMVNLAWGMSKREEDMLRQARLCNTIGIDRQREIVKEEAGSLELYNKDMHHAKDAIAYRSGLMNRSKA